MPLVVGCARSGTTLLRAILDAHPDLAVAPECGFVLRMAKSRQRYERDGGFDLEGFERDLLGDRAFAEWRPVAGDVAARLGAARPEDVPAAIREVFAAYAAHHGKRAGGAKTPYFVRWIGFLAELFPEARFIHLIRDGRDVALSLAEVGFGPDNAVQGALHWRSRVEAGRRQGAPLGPERYRELRYEDLVADPAGRTRELCAFLGIPYDEDMVDHADSADRVIASTRDPSRHAKVRLAPTTGLRDWRREMEPGDAEAFETLAGDLLEELGYERRSRPGRGLEARQVALVADEARRLRRRAFRHRQRRRRYRQRLRRLQASRWGRLGGWLSAYAPRMGTRRAWPGG